MNKKQIRTFIENNMHVFKQGNVFDEAFITNAFGIAQPQTGLVHADAVRAYGDFNVRKVGAQNRLNKVLALRGVYITQYEYTKYRVKMRAEIDPIYKKSQVNIYARASKKKAERGDILETGFRAHRAVLSTATPITDGELRKIK